MAMNVIKSVKQMFAKKHVEHKQLRHWKKTADSLEVVGTFYHRDACQRFADIGNSRVLVFFAAELRPDNDNEHDANAVAVFGGREKLGHLSRNDAEKYRAVVGDEPTVCDAVMSGGGDAGEKKRDYDIQVFLSFLESPSRRTKPSHQATRMRAETMFAAQSEIGIYIGPIDTAVANMCAPGDKLTAWHKDGMTEVHFFIPGSIGGGGRAGVVQLSSLVNAGLKPQSITCVVKDVGSYFVIIELKKSQ